MSLPHVILGMLQWGPQSGYDLDKQMKRYVRFAWESNQSAVYRALYKLRDQGLVEFETVRQEDNPDKKVYSITTSGLAELKQWLARPGLVAPTHFPFLVQLFWSGSIPIEEQIPVIEDRLRRTREELAILEERADFRDGIQVPLPEDALIRGVHRNGLSLDYGIRRYRFEIEWMEDTLAMLRYTLKQGGEPEWTPPDNPPEDDSD